MQNPPNNGGRVVGGTHIFLEWGVGLLVICARTFNYSIHGSHTDREKGCRRLRRVSDAPRPKHEGIEAC